eukprot:scaffold8701_cov120-Isochrysis_galbana.AAC.2
MEGNARPIGDRQCSTQAVQRAAFDLRCDRHRHNLGWVGVLVVGVTMRQGRMLLRRIKEKSDRAPRPRPFWTGSMMIAGA